jgi:hypothetical protein
MTTKALGGILAAILGLLAVVCLGVAALFGDGATASACGMPMPSGATSIGAPTGVWRPVGRFDAQQVGFAATIVTVGAQMGVPIRGWIIAVATALQESDLRNPPGGDQDSIGLFQQRPSQGWGTPEQIRDPVYASGKFYEKLLTIPDWLTLPLTDAAQAVQHSAYPDAYAQHEPDATMLVSTVGSSANRAMAIDLERCPSSCPTILSNGGFPGPVSASATAAVMDSAERTCAAGDVVLARAATWLAAWGGGPVPYLSSEDPSTWFAGYRRDCSGFASMALGLAGPGLTSAGLAAGSRPIPKSALSAGDLLINPAPDLAGHVVIFDRWVDATMTSYVGYEQSGDGGTHHRVIPYPYFGDYPMRPYRWNN